MRHLTPIFLNRETVSLDSGRMMSARAITPLSCPLIITKTVVLPRDNNSSTCVLSSLKPNSFRYPELTIFTSFPRITPSTPFPGIDLKFSTGKWSVNSAATPRAMGCSEWDSRDAAYFRISSGLRSSRAMTWVTPNSPWVRVPVLSKIMASMLRAFSKEVLFLINNPLLADSAVETATTRGMASPSAWGQVVTITVTALSREKARSCPFSTIQVTRVMNPPVSAISVRYMANRSARFCVLDWLDWASSTRLITWDRNESFPVFIIST